MNALTTIPISLAALDQMMPMHVLIGPGEVITHVGPTLAKISPGNDLVGQLFFDAFAPRRTRCQSRILDACKEPGTKVYLRLLDAHHTQLIGTATGLMGQEGVLMNLSFGISVVDAVRRYNLAGSDFAATDLTLEMLYLVEAKSAAQEESGNLNQRLNGAKQAAEADAASDMLTGLRNRRVLDQVLNRLISRDDAFSLMHLDLDFFKAVNDTQGHAAGDFVLQEVARILVEETRSDDTVARVGGDEFVLVFDGLTDPVRLNNIARRMIARLEQPMPFKDDLCRISASIGIVSSTAYDQPEAERMLHDADTALYASKNRGRACFTQFEPGMTGVSRV